MKRTILDFTGIYRQQTVLREKAEEYLDCSGMTGTDCYCDPETEKKLAELLKGLPSGGIHLLDSGNYHYMSKLFLDTCPSQISLVMLDHHTDMQPPALLPVLSCGSWLADTLRENPRVRQVFLIGPPRKSLEQIPPEYRHLTAAVSQEELEEDGWEAKFGNFQADYPVYFSVDKDVLSPQVCRTNWDQGSMNLNQMETILRWFGGQRRILGADICGEPDFRRASDREFRQSAAVDCRLIDLFSNMGSLDRQRE